MTMNVYNVTYDYYSRDLNNAVIRCCDAVIAANREDAAYTIAQFKRKNSCRVVMIEEVVGSTENGYDHSTVLRHNIIEYKITRKAA